MRGKGGGEGGGLVREVITFISQMLNYLSQETEHYACVYLTLYLRTGVGTVCGQWAMYRLAKAPQFGLLGLPQIF